ncbi:hypothetical protein AXG93_2482s1160 [Marchantia polymorpha subsp. ruderalis]|uniref:Uncharacterized protein n=1 Tax=Marchantia polymorpha subsp. ruderalis TaxID=1480154 RepID=A0A176VC33_MARPO|nr:hypothetical protein AXG93_2482s1160 [Marchantia polymorpha subsp. ruderalis]
MGCLTATERVQFPLLSRSNPGQYVKDVEVDNDEEETHASTPPTQQSAGGESFAARVPRKRRWKGEAEKGQHRDSAALKRKRPLHELCSRPKQKARRLVLPASSAETGRAAGEKETPSSEEDGNTRAAEGSADLSTPKARMPSAEARRPSGQERRHAAPMNVSATDRCSARAPYADSPSGLGPSARAPSAQSPSAQRRKGKEPAEDAPSAQGPSAQGIASREPSGQAPSAQGPSAQGTSGEPPSAQPPSAVDVVGTTASAEAPPTNAPSAEAPLEQDLTEERNDKQKREAQLQSAQTPSAVDAFGDAELVVTGRASGTYKIKKNVE